MTGADALLERELKQARGREAEYRVRLARHRELSRQLRAHAATLREALLGASGDLPTLTRLLTSIAQQSSAALGTARASIWVFDGQREALVCRSQIPASAAGSPEPRIATAAIPRYLAALDDVATGAVAVSDARNDPRTSELAEYLAQHQIGALLDIPIFGAGALHGVLCHEHQGGARDWHDEEIDFASDVGALVGLALEAERRIVAERTARGTEAKYQHLVETLPVAVYSFQARTGQLEYLSPRVFELAGIRPEQMLAPDGMQHWLDAMMPEDRDLVRKRLAGSVFEGFDEEIVYRIRVDGQQRWIRDTCRVVRDARGKPFAIQGTLADITALKEAELARAEVERRYRTLLENVDLLAVILSASGRIEFVNECFLRTIGCTREEAIGADGFELIIPEGEREPMRTDFLKSMHLGRLVPRFESYVRTHQLGLRRILWTNTLLRDSAGAVIGSSSLGIDITLRMQAEAAQLEQQKLESLGRLAATVAHDFNNLLTIISHAASTLAATPGANAAAYAELDAAFEHATGLTRSLLAYARKEPIKPTLTDVDAQIAAALPMLRTLLGVGIELSHHLGAGSARVVIDGTQLRQILVNLVLNAGEATRGHGRHVRITTGLVTLEADQARAKRLFTEGTYLLLSVADDGRGMSRTEVERAFEPFFTTKPAGEGTGLGLAMCTTFVRRAGGLISVDSAPGEGSTFSVHLPVAKLAAAITPRAPAPARPAAARARADGATVLIVEDNETIRNLISSLLAGHGLRVLEADDLQGARRVLASEPVDVLLTDGTLPDGDGRALVLDVARGARPPKVVLMSGSPPSPELVVDATVLKPFHPDALVAAVMKLVR